MGNFIKKHLEIILGALVAFLTPIYPILLATGAFVTCDLLTGIYASKKRGEGFNSKKMGNSISKCIFYFIAIILGYVMELPFVKDLPISKIIAGIIAAVEFKSNLENITAITGIDFTKVLQQKMDEKRGGVPLDQEQPK